MASHYRSDTEYDGIIDSYKNSLESLEDKIIVINSFRTCRISLDNISRLLKRKLNMKRESNYIIVYFSVVSVNVNNFEKHFEDTMSQFNAVEVNLNCIESWIGLPAECFSITGGNVTDPDISSIQDEAQNLCDISQSIRNSLLSLLSLPKQEVEKKSEPMPQSIEIQDYAAPASGGDLSSLDNPPHSTSSIPTPTSIVQPSPASYGQYNHSRTPTNMNPNTPQQ